jgi:hypothetical protein
VEQGLVQVQVQVQVGLALVVQVVGPVAVIRHGIIRRQVVQLLERPRRDLAGNQHQQRQQGASSSDAPTVTPRVVSAFARAGAALLRNQPSSRMFMAL